VVGGFLLAMGLAAGAEAGDKVIDDVRAAPFRFGAMAIGQAKDVDYARAEGLGLVPTSPLNAYLGAVLAKLLAQSPVQGVPARVYVRASGDWAAKTTADANIYVALGVLLRVDDEDEVAALLGHEVAHVILGHANADVVQGVQQRALQLSGLALEAQSLVAEAGGGGRAAQASGERARVQEQSQALLVNTTLIAPAWSRDQERAADALGVDLMVRAGYAPRAMVSLLRKQATFETARAADPEEHALEQRLSAFGVDPHAVTSEQTAKVAGGAGAAVAGELGALAEGALGAALSWGSKKVKQAESTHPKTSERIADVERYVAREYPDASSKAPQVEPWDAAKEQDGTVDVLENYIAAIDAKEKLSAGDVTGAGRLVKASLGGPTRRDAYPNYVDAAVRLAQGTPAPALAAYDTALAGPEPAGAIYTAASALHLQAGRNEKAASVIESGYARLQQPPSLTLPLIHTYHAVGRQADASRVAATCAARWPTMQAACLAEANGSAP
jgi:predicted Zn-dependent protease